ncbi:nucleotide exchange factor GrpE [Radiobacillus kanasensis]|uniref:nucleotide exchange factor GrpE n=1 Tax=Radiobacillus kanasensis TaxID=2844358 RepID=UPI001E46FC0E|nr:nucleotide exchange factor GrpE [Radiobacillus kanasensis]UFT97827.1 nucleotide exchange factor GrpE [Radiobacillus kanasensis]
MEEKDQVKETTEENQQEEVVNAEQEVVEESAETEEVNEELEKLKQEKAELNDRFSRMQAEYDNFRKRTQKEKESDRKYKSQALVTELLPVVDNFERALAVHEGDQASDGFVEGIKMVYKQLTDALEKEGVEVIAAEGEAFDPHLHQAVMQVEDDQYEANSVIEVLQAGYKLKDKVIRPAMVKVNQ